LQLGQKLLTGDKQSAQAWNFGPDHTSNRSVEALLQEFQSNWSTTKWHIGSNPQVHEAKLLHLDSSLARDVLDWSPVWNFSECVASTASWYREWRDHKRCISNEQLSQYIDRASAKGRPWARKVK
jgi:CDP-glucose 4,6-dehydratase